MTLIPLNHFIYKTTEFFKTLISSFIDTYDMEILIKIGFNTEVVY